MPDLTIVAGIDPSLTNTAVVLLSSEGEMRHTLIQPGKLRGVERLKYIYEKVYSAICWDKKVPVLLAIEGYDYKGFSTIPLAECNAVIQLACHTKNIAFIHAAPAQVKKFATGCSQAEKSHIMSRYGLDNEHVADARALAEIALEYTLGVSTRRCEIEVVKKLKAGKTKPKTRVKKIKTPWPVSV